MPIMPRCDKKAQKIAFNILGTPGNLRKQKPKKIKEAPSVRTEPKYEELSRITGL